MTEHEWIETLRTARVALRDAIERKEAAEQALLRSQEERQEALRRVNALQDEFDVWLLGGEQRNT